MCNVPLDPAPGAATKSADDQRTGTLHGSQSIASSSTGGQGKSKDQSPKQTSTSLPTEGQTGSPSVEGRAAQTKKRKDAPAPVFANGEQPEASKKKIKRADSRNEKSSSDSQDTGEEDPLTGKPISCERELGNVEKALKETPEKIANAPQDDDSRYLPYEIDRTIIYPQSPNPLPFSVYALFDPSIPGAVPPGARRYAFHSTLSTDEERLAMTKPSQLLLHKGVKPEDFVITFPSSTDERRLIQIAYTKFKDFKRTKGMPFTWNGKPVEFVAEAAHLGKLTTTFKISNVYADQKGEMVIKALIEATKYKVGISHIWRDEKVISYPDSKGVMQTVKTRGDTYWALGRYVIHSSPRRLSMPNELPGWIRISNDVTALHFVDRTDRCSNCKHYGLYPPNHTTAECIHIRCPDCGEKGHVPKTCEPRAWSRRRRT